MPDFDWNKTVGSLATIGLFGFGLSIAFIDTHWQILIQSKVGLELQARVFQLMKC